MFGKYERHLLLLAIVGSVGFFTSQETWSQATLNKTQIVVQVNGTTMRVVGVPKKQENKMGVGWLATIEAKDASDKVVSRINAAVTGCEPNQLGPKLGRMFIFNDKTHYWSPDGEQVVDQLASAVCHARPQP